MQMLENDTSDALKLHATVLETEKQKNDDLLNALQNIKMSHGILKNECTELKKSESI